MAASLASKNIGNVGNTGTRVFLGIKFYQVNNAGTGGTYEIQTLAATDFDSIEVILAAGFVSGQLAQMPVNVAVSVLPQLDTTGSIADNATWVNATFAGSANGNLTPPTSGAVNINYYITDPISISSIPRTDVVGGLPVIAIRCWMSGVGKILLSGDGTSWLTPWLNHPLRPIVARGTGGDHVTTPSVQQTFTSSGGVLTGLTSPIVGYRLKARSGKVVTIGAFGDSITGGGTAKYLGEGAIGKATFALNGKDGIAYEFMNLGWSGTSGVNFPQLLTDVLTQGLIPDVAVFPNGSPNNAPSTITPTIVTQWRNSTVSMVSLCQKYRITPVVWSMLPSSFSANSWGTSDALRDSWNKETVASQSKGMLVVDAATIMSPNLYGTDYTATANRGNMYDANGQVYLNPSLGVAPHPNEAGYTVLSNYGFYPLLSQLVP